MVFDLHMLLPGLRANSREELMRALRAESLDEYVDYLAWHNKMGALAISR
jgi:hypothetical protein